MNNILKRIENRRAKEVDIGELEKLAGELRLKIISTVSSTGGHLAPNLGVIEITLALHSTFNLPDKIVWDVGHQCYAHKIVTGRKEKFDTIRTRGVLVVFQKG